MSQFLVQFNHDVHAGSPLLCTPRMPSWWGPLAPHSHMGRSDWAARALSVCAVRSPPSALSVLNPAPVPDPLSFAFGHRCSRISLPSEPHSLSLLHSSSHRRAPLSTLSPPLPRCPCYHLCSPAIKCPCVPFSVFTLTLEWLEAGRRDPVLARRAREASQVWTNSSRRRRGLISVKKA